MEEAMKSTCYMSKKELDEYANKNGWKLIDSTTADLEGCDEEEGCKAELVSETFITPTGNVVVAGVDYSEWAKGSCMFIINLVTTMQEDDDPAYMC